MELIVIHAAVGETNPTIKHERYIYKTHTHTSPSPPQNILSPEHSADSYKLSKNVSIFLLYSRHRCLKTPIHKPSTDCTWHAQWRGACRFRKALKEVGFTFRGRRGTCRSVVLSGSVLPRATTTPPPFPLPPPRPPTAPPGPLAPLPGSREVNKQRGKPREYQISAASDVRSTDTYAWLLPDWTEFCKSELPQR